MSRHLCTDKCDTGKRKTGNRKTGKPVSGNLLRSLTLTLLLPGGSFAGESLLLQSTTSTANSGLYDFLLPKFKEQSGVQVHVVAVGTGQAIRNATNCDGDVLLVHAKAAEEKFVADGFGVQRFDVMYNDFVIVGPQDDPADVGAADGVLQALQKIADTTSVFASRGDNSGTHKKELTLWQSATVDTAAGNGRWYRETGAGMGATLNTAVGMGAYTLTDRATWLSFKNRQNHRVLFEGDQQLFNQYGVIQVNPERCPNVKADTGQQFIAWLTGEDGQRLIGEYAVNGEQLFYPNAK
jgi:tungstate transport system substrate-binding protein